MAHLSCEDAVILTLTLERTFFMLNWYQDPNLRRRDNLGLNKGESRNSLCRVVFLNRLGEIRDRSYENQRCRASGLNLIVASIILWNTVYLAKAIEFLQQEGYQITNEQLSHLSPLGWSHINLLGAYEWILSYVSRFNQLRPLRVNQKGFKES